MQRKPRRVRRSSIPPTPIRVKRGGCNGDVTCKPCMKKKCTTAGRRRRAGDLSATNCEPCGYDLDRCLAYNVSNRGNECDINAVLRRRFLETKTPDLSMYLQPPPEYKPRRRRVKRGGGDEDKLSISNCARCMYDPDECVKPEYAEDYCDLPALIDFIDRKGPVTQLNSLLPMTETYDQNQARRKREATRLAHIIEQRKKETERREQLRHHEEMMAQAYADQEAAYLYEEQQKQPSSSQQVLQKPSKSKVKAERATLQMDINQAEKGLEKANLNIGKNVAATQTVDDKLNAELAKSEHTQNKGNIAKLLSNRKNLQNSLVTLQADRGLYEGLHDKATAALQEYDDLLAKVFQPAPKSSSSLPKLPPPKAYKTDYAPAPIPRSFAISQPEFIPEYSRHPELKKKGEKKGESDANKLINYNLRNPLKKVPVDTYPWDPKLLAPNFTFGKSAYKNFPRYVVGGPNLPTLPVDYFETPVKIKKPRVISKDISKAVKQLKPKRARKEPTEKKKKAKKLKLY